jgi:hypothetical protein
MPGLASLEPGVYKRVNGDRTQMVVLDSSGTFKWTESGLLPETVWSGNVELDDIFLVFHPSYCTRTHLCTDWVVDFADEFVKMA